jgi:CSLREA domain-containing protein
MGKHRFWLTVLSLIGAFLGGVGLPALAAGYVVNTLNDNATAGDSLCTLREAIESANNAGKQFGKQSSRLRRRDPEFLWHGDHRR